MQLKYITNNDYMYPSSSHKNSSNAMENKIEQLGEFSSLLLVDLLYRSKRHSMRNNKLLTNHALRVESCGRNVY